MSALDVLASDKLPRLAEYCAQEEIFVAELPSAIDGGAGPQTKCAVVE